MSAAMLPNDAQLRMQGAGVSACLALQERQPLVRTRRAEGHRRALHYLLRRDRWSSLPSGPGTAQPGPGAGGA